MSGLQIYDHKRHTAQPQRESRFRIRFLEQWLTRILTRSPPLFAQEAALFINAQQQLRTLGRMTISEICMC